MNNDQLIHWYKKIKRLFNKHRAIHHGVIIGLTTLFATPLLLFVIMNAIVDRKKPNPATLKDVLSKKSLDAFKKIIVDNKSKFTFDAIDYTKIEELEDISVVKLLNSMKPVVKNKVQHIQNVKNLLIFYAAANDNNNMSYPHSFFNVAGKSGGKNIMSIIAKHTLGNEPVKIDHVTQNTKI